MLPKMSSYLLQKFDATDTLKIISIEAHFLFCPVESGLENNHRLSLFAFFYFILYSVQNKCAGLDSSSCCKQYDC